MLPTENYKLSNTYNNVTYLQGNNWFCDSTEFKASLAACFVS